MNLLRRLFPNIMRKYLNRTDASGRSEGGTLRPAGWLVMVLFLGPLSLLSVGAPSGIEWELRPFGSSSLISNSVAMTWDDRARLWVLETQGAGESARSRLLILSAEDGDGSKISTKIFADGLPRATGFEWSPQGVVLGSPPQLLLLQDTNHDDRIDERQVLWQGLGFPADRAGLTHFVWGPDNGLYCLFQTPNTVKVGARGVSTNEWMRLNPGVLRFDLESRTLEAFAEGPAKPSGLEFDGEGNLFMTSAARESLFHVVEGSTCLPLDHFPRPMDAFATLVPPINDRTLSRFGSGGLLAVPAGELLALFSSQFLLGGTNPISFQPVAMRSRGASFRASAGAGDQAMPLSGDLLSRSIRHNFGAHDPKLVEMSLKFLLELADQSPTLCTQGLEGMMLGQKGSKMWSGHKGVNVC